MSTPAEAAIAHSSVVVVGGGIGGAVLALALGRRGQTVCVIEREATPPRPARPELLARVTLSALERLGVDLHGHAAVPLKGFELRVGDRILLTVEDEDMRAAGAMPSSTDPGLTRMAILEAAVATGTVTVLRGAEVTDLLREHGRVAGVRGRRGAEPFALRGHLVVGDDGGQSVVRTALGIGISLQPFPLDFVTFRAPLPPGYPADTFRAWLRPDGLRRDLFATLIVPLPSQALSGVLLVPAGLWDGLVQGSPEVFWESLSRLTPLAGWVREHLTFPTDFVRVRRPFGHARAYGAAGAVILGDAAHPMSPVGGQGANAAIWDALALAEAVAPARGHPDRDVNWLPHYERRRRPANARALSFSERAAGLIQVVRKIPGGWLLIPVVLRLLQRSSPAKRRFLRQVATAFLD